MGSVIKEWHALFWWPIRLACGLFILVIVLFVRHIYKGIREKEERKQWEWGQGQRDKDQ